MIIYILPDSFKTILFLFCSVLIGECHWTGEYRGPGRNRNIRRRQCWKARANRCGERTRHFARRTSNDSVVVVVVNVGCSGRGNVNGYRGRGTTIRPQTFVAPVEQQHGVHRFGQAPRARTNAGSAKQAHASSAAAADQLQVAGRVADRVHRPGGVAVLVGGRQSAVQPEGIADRLYRDNADRGRQRQAADARTVDDRTNQTGTAGTAAPGIVEEAKSATRAVHAAAAVAAIATAARFAAAEENWQRRKHTTENGPVNECGRSHIGFAHSSGRRRRRSIVRRQRRRK